MDSLDHTLGDRRCEADKRVRRTDAWEGSAGLVRQRYLGAVKADASLFGRQGQGELTFRAPKRVAARRARVAAGCGGAKRDDAASYALAGFGSNKRIETVVGLLV